MTWLCLTAVLAQADLAEVHLETTPPDAAVTVDGALQGLAPRTERLPPGVHVFTFEHPDARTSTMTVQLVPGERRTVRVALSPEHPRVVVPLAGTATLLGGLAVLTAGLLLRFDAEAHAREVEALARRGGVWDARGRALEQAGFAAQAWSWGLVVTGSAISAAGVLTTLIQLLRTEPAAPALTLAPLPGGACATWSLAW